MTPDAAKVTPLTDEIGKVLRENGIVAEPTTPGDAESGIHSWRCGYPDTYGDGPCECFAGLVDDLAAVSAAREAKAAAKVLRDAAQHDGDELELVSGDHLRARADELDPPDRSTP